MLVILKKGRSVLITQDAQNADAFVLHDKGDKLQIDLTQPFLSVVESIKTFMDDDNDDMVTIARGLLSM